MRTSFIYLFVVLLAILSVSCENTEAELLDYSISSSQPDIELDYSASTILINFSESVTSAENLIADFILSEGADAFVGSNLQLSGISENSYEEPFSFNVVSEDEKLSIKWMVKSSNNNYTNNWGLGGFLKIAKSLNRSYEWYINQAATGPLSDYNCAPSSVVMASLWCDEYFPYSVQDARRNYHPEGGGWYTSDIDNCLMDYNIAHSIIELATSIEETAQIIKEQIDNGNILLLAVDVHYLHLCENDSFRVDKYYETIKLGTGHAILIKGYKLVDGQLFFEAYDPIGYNYRYSDGQFKGQDRYYRDDDIFTATFGSWNYAFIISDSLAKKVSGNILNASEIPSILIL